MRRPSLASTLIVLFLLALPACGSADSTATQAGAETAGAERDDGASAGGDGAAGGAESSVRRGLALKRVGSFDSPVYVTGAPGFPRLLFVVEQPGRIQVLRGGKRLSRPFLNLSGRVQFGGERGLLSIAFPPNYAKSKRFYVYYTDAAGSITVDEFRRGSATRALPGSRRPVISIPHAEFSNHNGGQLQFLGNLLFLGSGDGGSGGDPSNNAQNRESLLGKLIRIDPRRSGGRAYSVPPSNPFVGRPGRDEIYSLGLRNPFRFSFDTVTAKAPRIAIGDVGQSEFEEIDYTTVGRANGANFGWDAFEGFAPYTGENSGTPDPGGTVKPIFAFPHRRGGSCSVTGGLVVANRNLRALYKRYLYADFCEGELRTLVPSLKRARGDRKIGLSVPTPTSFGEDTRKRLYITSLDGPVYRIVAR